MWMWICWPASPVPRLTTGRKLAKLAQSTAGANPVPPEQPIAANLAGRDAQGQIHAAQLAFLSPALPQTLMLEVIA